MIAIYHQTHSIDFLNYYLDEVLRLFHLYTKPHTKFTALNELGYSIRDFLPSQITDILAYELENRDKAPIWTMSFQLIHYFTYSFKCLIESKNLKSIKINSNLKNKLIDTCNNFIIQIKQLGELQNHLPLLLNQIIEKQNKIFQKIRENEFRSKNHEIDSIKEMKKNAITNFQWDTFTNDLVAEKKFSLHSEIFSNFQEKIAQLKSAIQPTILDSNQTLTSKIAFRAFKALSLGFWKFRKSYPKILEEEFSNDWNRYFKNIQTFDDLLKRAEQSEELMNKDVQNKIEYNLVFDKQTRKITWIQPPYSRDFIPLVKMTMIPKEGIFFHHTLSQYCNSETLKEVQSTIGVNNNERKSLETFISSYKDLLTKLIEGQEIEPTHPLYSMSDGEVVFSSKPDEIPLVFPKKMLRNLEPHLYPISKLNHLTDYALLVPSYEFSTDTNQLFICYTLHSPSGSRLKFAKFLLAEFDLLTVESFNPHLKFIGIFMPTLTDYPYHDFKRETFNLSEFLIQAMYSQFANLGLPAKGSLFFPYVEQIAPFELPFIGLYKLWQQKPNQVIHYNSQVVDSNTSMEEFFIEPIIPIILSAYDNSMAFIESKKQDIIENDPDYKKQFNLAVMLLRLYTNFSSQEIIQKLEEELHIYSPDQFDFLKEPNLIQNHLKQKIQHFLKQFFYNLNEKTIDFMGYLEFFKNMIQWIQNDFKKLKDSHEDRLPIDRNHKLNPFTRGPLSSKSSDINTISFSLLKDFFSLPETDPIFSDFEVIETRKGDRRNYFIQDETL